MAARMAMIAITTSSSISVNARVPGRTGSNDFMVTRYYFDTELRKVAFFEGSWNCVSIEFSSEFLLFVPLPTCQALFWWDVVVGRISTRPSSRAHPKFLPVAVVTGLFQANAIFGVEGAMDSCAGSGKHGD